MFHNVWMHKSSKPSPFQEEQSVPINSMRPSTRCTEGPDSIRREREQLQAPSPSHGQQLSYGGNRQWEQDCSLCLGGRYVGAITIWPTALVCPTEVSSTGTTLAELARGVQIFRYLFSSEQASQKLLSWFTGHALGCYLWAGWFTSGCWQSQRLPTNRAKQQDV